MFKKSFKIPHFPKHVSNRILWAFELLLLLKVMRLPRRDRPETSRADRASQAFAVVGVKKRSKMKFKSLLSEREFFEKELGKQISFQP